MKQTKTLLELADDYAKAYFMGRGEDARKLLQAAVINAEVSAYTSNKLVFVVDHVGSSYGDGMQHTTVVVGHSLDRTALVKGAELYVKES